jgi:hypothetical protein
MNIERMLRGIAGFFILASLGLAVTVSIHWLWFTAFVGLNLFQSALTDWCPMITILQKTGFKRAGACARGEADADTEVD